MESLQLIRHGEKARVIRLSAEYDGGSGAKDGNPITRRRTCFFARDRRDMMIDGWTRMFWPLAFGGWTGSKECPGIRLPLHGLCFDLRSVDGF